MTQCQHPTPWAQPLRRHRFATQVLVVAALSVVLAGCQAFLPDAPEVEGPPAKEMVWALTTAGDLVYFNAGQPRRILNRVAVKGLVRGDRLVGMDYRVAKGVLFAVGHTGQIYTLDTATGQLKTVGAGTPSVPLRGVRFGVDFNPALDRIRVISDAGQNLRFHPDTGAQIDFDAKTPGGQADPDLAFAPGDPQHGQVPKAAAAAYTYNNKDEKLTTNFALDERLGTLVMQGSREGVAPVESPNLGVLRTVGTLGTGPLTDAAFDISDVRNTALAALRTARQPTSRLYAIDLATGKARFVGTVGTGEPLVGMAIEP